MKNEILYLYYYYGLTFKVKVYIVILNLYINLKTKLYNILMEAIVSTNDINNYSVSELNYLRESIENMNKFNQVEVLRIFNKYKDVILNENKYGIHINLSELKREVLDELSLYVKYVNTQESTLNAVEQKKEDYRNTYFTKDIKDTTKN